MKWKTRYIRFKRYSRKFFKWSLSFLLLITLLAYIVFKSSWVQTYITQKLGDQLSKKTGTEIIIGEVDFQPFDTFVLRDLLVLDHHRDTLLYSSDFYFEIDEYDLEKYQFNLDLLELNDTYINITTYFEEEQSNLELFLNKLSSLDSSNKKVKPKCYIEDIGFENLKFRLWNENDSIIFHKVDFNHMLLTGLNMDADDFIFKEDLININIDLLSFKECSGFEVLGMSGQLMMDEKNLLLKYFEFETNETDINGDISFEYKNFDDFTNFVELVYLKTSFDETIVHSNDVAYFIDAVKDLNQSIKFQGDINGTISTLSAKNLKFNYGDMTSFEGEIKFNGLGVLKNPIINAKISHLITFEEDIKNIPLPPFKLGKTIKTPNWMKNVGEIEFEGDFNGPTSNFEATGIVKTSAGIIKSDVFFTRDSVEDETKIVGKIITDKFDLGKTIGNSNFGLLSMNGALDALAQFENNRLIFSGEIPRIDYRGYSYSNINMDGLVKDEVFSGKLSVNDDNLVFDFDGAVDFSTPNLQRYDFEAELRKANIVKINWSQRDSSTQLKGKLSVNLVGNEFEDLDGELKLKDILWREHGKTYNVDSFHLTSVKEKNRELIVLDSDLIHGKIEGNYNLGEIYPTIINVFSNGVPSLVKTVELENFKGGNNFNVMFKLFNYEIINELFTPELNFANNTRLSGRFNDNNKSFTLQIASDSIQINQRKINGIKLFTNNSGETLNLNGKASYIQVVNQVGIENFSIKSSVDSNMIDFQIGYNNSNSSPTFGNIKGNLNLNNLDTIKLGIGTSKIVYRDALWKVDTTAFAEISSNYINVQNLNFNSSDQFFNIHGIASENSEDHIDFTMNNFQMSGVQYFWNYLNLDITGRATGSLRLNGAFDDQLFTSNLEVNQMTLNTQELGKVLLSTHFLQSDGTINVDLTVNGTSKTNPLKNLVLKGKYFPYEGDRLEMSANLKNTQLKLLEKYFDGVLSKFNGGKTSGKLEIKGTVGHPELYGSLKVDQLEFSIDYLNVTESVNGQKLNFNKDFIIFSDFELSNRTHPKSKAKINGYVNLNGFNSISYQMDSIFLEEFFCLNTNINTNSTYHGKAYVNGLMQLHGDESSHFIGGRVSTTASTRIDYKTDKNGKKSPVRVPVVTSLELPLDDNEDLEISEFVSFVNLNDTSIKRNKKEEEFDFSHLDMDFNFEINPEAKVKIIFDPTVGDEINTKGQGNIGMRINTNGKFNMYGEYAVTEGNYFFTLQNIISKRFLVKPGSKISWDGNPLDAKIAMNTYYKSRANLMDLVDSNQVADFDNLTRQFDNRISVYSNIGLYGSLWKPDLKIGITLPNGTPEEKNFLTERIFGEDEINRQAFSLILTSRFLPPTNGVESIVSDRSAGLNNGMQFVEGQINNALSGLLHPNLDIGLDYNDVQNSGTEENLTKDELRLLAGFQYKNLSFRTDYDINNQVGDIEAEFRITAALKAKAYHKSINDITAVNNQTTTTTYGLGAAYQKSFDSFKDLFKATKKKK